ncbi:hypothetical protein CU097_006764 [Rhizopus azygosporus]|uniref:Transposase Tc1-like domain-containing protein n=1 Tax=Rhizopus azygosporus TaxID=86630 RepID=A0A367J229_RHIAZ|nr:hypothetical protein CU097_006764 [Rhizopus azygosporus]
MQTLSCQNFDKAQVHLQRDNDLKHKSKLNQQYRKLYTSDYTFRKVFERFLSAAAAATQLGIHVRTAQKWAKQYEKDPDSIFEKRRKTGRPRILHDEHKKAILECIDENPSIVLDEVMKKLKQMFTELKVSKTTLFDFVKQHCNLSLKKARLQPKDRNSEEKI